jgi:hypothetical protein
VRAQTSSFILVANGLDGLESGRVNGFEVTQRRLRAKLWPLYANTPHRKELKPGDRLIVYVAGAGMLAQHFVATADAGLISSPIRYRADGADTAGTPPAAVLNLVNPQLLSLPIAIRPILRRLSFVPKRSRKWGSVMHRGCKKISARDFRIIMHSAARQF